MPKTYQITEQEAPDLAAALKGLAHPLRLRIVAELCNNALCVNDICQAVGAKQAAVSQHLAPLRMLGILKVNRVGGKAIYSLGKPRLPDMMECIKCCGR